jgi:hypothetical protein
LPLRTFRETPGVTVQSVLRLVLDGVLHIDWWEPVGLESAVSISPIGRQVWPFPARDPQAEPWSTERRTAKHCICIPRKEAACPYTH